MRGFLSRSCVAVLALAASTTTMTTTSQTSADAASCAIRERSVTTGSGRDVWIPSTLVSPWTSGGGDIRIDWQKGEDRSRAKGSADTVSGSAGVSFSVVEASAAYDREWNRSTTRTTTRSTTVSRGWDIPKRGTWRVRWYHRGREFRATKTVFYANCPSRSVTRIVRVPLTKNTLGTRLITLERYSRRNQFRY